MATSPVRFFVLAGQSNVLGQATIQHLEDLILAGTSDLQEFRDGSDWVERDDVFATFDREYGDPQASPEGPLAADIFGGDPGVTFGPETGFGFRMGDNLDDDVVIIKAGGVSALADLWIPPSSNGGNGGEFYDEMIADIADSLNRVNDIVGATGRTAELCGVVWFHGYADVFVDEFRNAYETNLINLISDVRSDVGISDLPFVIGQMGGQGAAPGTAEAEMRQIQANVVSATTNTVLSPTAQFVTSDVETNFICDEDFHYYCNADVMVNIGRQFATDMLSFSKFDSLVSSMPSPAPGDSPSAEDEEESASSSKKSKGDKKAKSAKAAKAAKSGKKSKGRRRAAFL